MGSQESKILAGGMETRKTNRFWKLRARAAEGKPTYQSSRVKGIIKISKSSSAKLRLCMNEKKQEAKGTTHQCLDWQTQPRPGTAEVRSLPGGQEVADQKKDNTRAEKQIEAASCS